VKKVEIETAIDLLPEPVNIYVNNVREGIEGLVPDILSDRFTTEKLARVKHE
jgi:hypothetical protein